MSSCEKKIDSPEYYWLDFAQELQKDMEPADPRRGIVDGLLIGEAPNILLDVAAFCALNQAPFIQPAVEDFLDGNWLPLMLDYARAIAYFRLCQEIPTEIEAMLQYTRRFTSADFHDAEYAPQFTMIPALGANKEVVPVAAIVTLNFAGATGIFSGSFGFKPSGQTDLDMTIPVDVVNAAVSGEARAHCDTKVDVGLYDNQDYNLYFPDVLQVQGGDIWVNFFYWVRDMSL